MEMCIRDRDPLLVAMQALSPANLNFFSAHPFCRNAVFPCSIHNKNRLPADSTKNSTQDGTLKNTPPKGNSSNITYTNRFATLWNSIGAAIVPYLSLIHIFQEFFTDSPLVRKYVSDEGNYEKIIKLYEEKDADTPLFLFLSLIHI